LSSFEKLGLDLEPDAVACAKYHVLSNGIGGVAVEYMAESDTRAWVRFRYPRWMYAGPAICGIPVEASRGFLHGWYAQNGVSLNNPRLGFVCVSEDVTGQFGLCGYFKEYDHELSEAERLVFAPDERPPAFVPADQPVPPAQDWSEERLDKANRNYAMEYVRNGLGALTDVIGAERTQMLASKAARLTGLQNYQDMREAIGATEGGAPQSAEFLAEMMRGMGDECSVAEAGDGGAQITQTGLRIVRDLDGAARELILSCWIELWRGAIHAQRLFLDVECQITNDRLVWRID
ncbi:MAG: hypothetical protein AAFQ15_11970, partial [Pseudomonadota bacterium]